MIVFYLVTTLLLCHFSFSFEPTKSEADSAYLAGDFSTSINLYAQLINEYPQSALLYFKLGNSYFKNNETGKAIWAYNKAKKIMPNHEDINFNLNFVLASSQIEAKNRIFDFSDWMARFLFGRSINFWAYIAIISAILTAVFLYLAKTTRAKNKRRIFMVGSITCAIFVAIGMSIAIAHYTYLNTLNQGIIIESIVEVKTAPTENEPVTFEIKEGAKFELKEKQNDWYRIEIDNKEGWIKKSAALLF